uniref:Uncharacterized protein n=1 Tax=Knipowitschia caucasica TaxID=637954 RepID=A0AAV2M8K6_KNICA
MVCFRRGGALPEGSQVSGSQVSGSQVSGSQVSGSRLVLGQALRLNDSGVFQCVAQNHLGPGRAEYDFTVTERSFLLADISDNLLMVLIGAGAGLLLLMVLLMVLVNRHHKNKHKRLQQELSQKT